MNAPHPAAPATLARGPIARVERAVDGQLVLHVGPIALRLSPSAAASLSRTLSDAIDVCELELASARPLCRRVS